jgi:hypothetical protein
MYCSLGNSKQPRQFIHASALSLEPQHVLVAELIGHRPATPFIVAAAGQRTVKAGREKVAALVVVFMFFREEILHLKPIIEHMFHTVKGILSLFPQIGAHAEPRPAS